MRHLFSFLFTTLDGFHTGPGGEFDWPNVDDDFHQFSIRQLNDVGTVVFGRITYAEMAAFWPTPEAAEVDPETAERMNEIDKVVYSSSLSVAEWNNTRLVSTDPVAHLDGLKRDGSPGDLAIFGSSTLTASLLDAGIVDEVRIMVNPILLGSGERLLAGIGGRIRLGVTRTMTFRNGNVLICAVPESSPDPSVRPPTI